MPTKRSTVWAVERTNWFGDCEEVNGASFSTKREAEAFAKELRQASKECDDPEDKETFTVVSYVWEREV